MPNQWPPAESSVALIANVWRARASPPGQLVRCVNCGGSAASSTSSIAPVASGCAVSPQAPIHLVPRLSTSSANVNAPFRNVVSVSHDWQGPGGQFFHAAPSKRPTPSSYVFT